MFYNKSIALGTITGVWANFYARVRMANEIGVMHVNLGSILLIILVIDHSLGYAISVKNKNYTSGRALQGVVKDMATLGLVFVCYFFDRLFMTGALFFACGAFALSYHNLQSIVANIYVLGWQKYFPMWLFKLLESEIKAKIKKITNEK